MAPYPTPTPVIDAFAVSRSILDRIITRLSDPEMIGCTEHVLEEYVTTAGRDLQRQLIQDQLDARAAAETRLSEVTGADTVVRRRAEPGHARQVATTVGRVQATRIAYRAPAVSNLHPADMILALPERLYSFPLQKTIVHEAATGSLRHAADTLHRITGQRISTGQLMDTVTAAARDIRDFYQHQTIAAGDPGDLLILTIDATGIAMTPTSLRNPAPPPPTGPQPPHARLSEPERTGRTRMATVIACYDARPAVRTAADILPATATERAARRPGPTATGRHLDASVEHGITVMTRRLFDHAQHRDPHHRRRWIALVDGNNHQIDRTAAEAHDRGITITIIIDFIHVLQYLWDAAADLHPTQPGRAGFVEHTARNLLDSNPAQVIHQLTITRHALGDHPAPGLDRAISYLTAKQPHLHYRQALAMGWPIATGVIEGACRHLVKDRLAITGARWSLPGAEAVLLLRALITNGDLDAYWTHHIQQEHQRVHTSHYQQQYELAA
ncbi:ISKra4 family transposase [Actinoplanes derwentensis]|uniref:ISKra4 family transposase n=1 Tax=Actinoplanes derwentensis TaxID=113562 RepID=A0A1H1TEX2_9ACTN|nr:ISKra4 family transposase [Actinoplanes derwentensis]GID89509.1 hypothetical protein Ade03nite_84330 [Actinoplanes derwentensis]SDS58760.1 hypothetical protein SAMN04489716_1120 [Actinoplanes derwentensis]